MFKKTSTIVSLLTAALLLAAVLPAMADENLDKAFETLKTYDWGQDRTLVKPIDDAVIASTKDAAAQKALEARLAAVLATTAPGCAKDYVCRELSLIGSAASVPALATLLGDEKLSHMGRYALERYDAPEAAKALRDALPKVTGKLKIGVINSLGVRRDAEAGPALIALLGDTDPTVAAAAAEALGSIGNSDAAKALAAFQTKAPEAIRLVAADAYLACAERLLADGKKLEALAIYKALNKPESPKHIRLAATRGMLATMGK